MDGADKKTIYVHNEWSHQKVVRRTVITTGG